MSVLDRDRWGMVGPEFERALEMDATERALWLDRLRGEDPALAADLEELLASHRSSQSEGFLEGSPATPEPTLSGQVLGAYTLVSPLGQGGMGTVWLARRSDGRFEGSAAVKLLNASRMGHTARERFRREGILLARLAHPHVARLLDAGVSPSGQPYIVLEHVEGEAIDRYCDARELDVASRLRLFLDVCAAVAHAHASLIVHRDIKPSNVLVGNDGHVKLLDFGIAKLLEGGASAGEVTALTHDGGRALTPEYAAPEQVTGGAITTATDVYALGVLLYVLLTGTHPAHEALHSPAELLRSITDAEPPRVSESAPGEALRRQLRGDLDTIAAKALKKDPGERYTAVTALADDVRRYLEHQPIRARPDTLGYRASKFVRRNRTAVALAGLALAALLAGLAGTWIQARRATRHAARAEDERRRANQEARAAEEQRDFALRQLLLAESVIDLNSFVLSDAAPAGKPVTSGDLLERAEEVVERQYAGSGEIHVEMLLSIGRQYVVQNENARARRVLSRAHGVASSLPDPTMRAKAACELAGAIVYDGETERAEELVRNALVDLPADSRHAMDRVRCSLRGSEVARWRGNTTASIERVEAARRTLREAAFPAPRYEMGIALHLAESYRLAGRMHDADAASADAAARITALGLDQTGTAGTLFNNWGLVVSALGRPRDAEPLFRKAIRIDSEDGSERGARPMILNNLARTLRELHRLDEAAGYAERAYRRAREAGDQNIVGQALMARAGIARERGDFGGATGALQELEPLLGRLLPPGHVAFSSLKMERALLASARGDLDEARRLADQAVAIGEASGQREAYLPRLLLHRSAIALAMGRVDEAEADAVRAFDAVKAARPGGFSSAIGRAQLAIARAQRAAGRRDQARSAAAVAVAQLRPTLGEEHPDTQSATRLAAGTAGQAP